MYLHKLLVRTGDNIYYPSTFPLSSIVKISRLDLVPNSTNNLKVGCWNLLSARLYTFNFHSSKTNPWGLLIIKNSNYCLDCRLVYLLEAKLLLQLNLQDIFVGWVMIPSTLMLERSVIHLLTITFEKLKRKIILYLAVTVSAP